MRVSVPAGSYVVTATGAVASSSGTAKEASYACSVPGASITGGRLAGTDVPGRRDAFAITSTTTLDQAGTITLSCRMTISRDEGANRSGTVNDPSITAIRVGSVG